MFYVCGNINLVVQCSLVLVKSVNVCCKDIEFHVTTQIHGTIRHLKSKYIQLFLSKEFFSVNILKNKGREKAGKEKSNQGRTFFCYSMKSEKKNLNGGKSEIFAESPDLYQGNSAE